MSAAWYNLCTAMFLCRIMHLWEKCFPTRPDMIGWNVFTPYVHQIVPVYLCHIHQVWTPPLDLNKHRAKHSPALSWVKMQTVSRCLDHRRATIPQHITLLKSSVICLAVNTKQGTLSLRKTEWSSFVAY